METTETTPLSALEEAHGLLSEGERATAPTTRRSYADRVVRDLVPLLVLELKDEEWDAISHRINDLMA